MGSVDRERENERVGIEIVLRDREITLKIKREKMTATNNEGQHRHQTTLYEGVTKLCLHFTNLSSLNADRDNNT